jgi:cell division protein FtsI/penicillin-binding protein 2
MTAASQYRKLYALALLLCGALAALGYRLVDLQVVRHGELQALAEQNTVRTIESDPARGQILDCRGILLATSLPAKVVCADPTLMGDQREEVARLLAPLLETNQAYLSSRLAPRLVEEAGKTNLSKYVVLKRKVPVETWDKIRAALAQDTRLNPKALFTEDDQARVYPCQRLAAHVLGYVDDEQNGLAGIEWSFNSDLSGIRGWRKTEMDKRQRELVAYRDQDVAPRDGYNVVLTLDAALQNIVETELAKGVQEHSPISISCLMLRPRTGEILAMATLPNFDPNHPGASPMEAMRNRVITDLAEPGSTFKIVVVTGGLNEGVVTLNDVFDCEHGQFHYAGRVLHDHEPFGLLSVEDIITKSSNIGAAKIGIRLGEEKLRQYIHDFGFGARTGIPLPGERFGLLPEKWSKVTIAQVPMGQGIAVTPLQMALAMCALANQGVLMRPMLVSRLEDANGKVVAQYEPQIVRRVARPEAVANMVKALKTVVTKEGTAVQAHLDNYTVAGKTGTAQKVEHGQYVRKYFSSFVGFFPADHPEVCILVVMDEPKEGYYGGMVSAPIFHNIAEQTANYLNLKPDIEPAPPVKQTLTAANEEKPTWNHAR